MEKLVSIINLTAGYDGKPAIENVSLDIFSKDFIGVIGPNGGGKTTLVKCIMGLLNSMSGSIQYHFNHKDNGIGYLPQQIYIDKKFPIRVVDVVLSGLQSNKRWLLHFSKQEKTDAMQMLEKFGITELSNKSINELSGGQLQRTLIARALMGNPKLLILDEPTTFVDSNFEKELNEMLVEINKNVAILMISHDVGTISYFVKTIACVNKNLHFHPSNIITKEQLDAYNCPIKLISHGDVPHTVLKNH